MDDAELVAGLAEGDLGALRVLHARHAAWLTIRLSKRCANRDLVDEVVQDTFVAAWRSAASFRGEGDVGAWLWGIAFRRLIDGFRAQHSTVWAAPEVAESAEDAVLVGVGYGDLGDSLRRLSPELLAVVQATILDGLTVREASRLLGLPTGTVKTRLMRAKRILREQLT
jgi:RNA polymerase sigma-70 factor, ECF subfamily